MSHVESPPLASPVSAWYSCDWVSVSYVLVTPPVVPGCLGSACPVAAAYCEVTTVTLASSAWFLPLSSGVYKGPLVIFSFFFFFLVSLFRD